MSSNKCWCLCICIIYLTSTVNTARIQGIFDDAQLQVLLSENIDGTQAPAIINAKKLTLKRFANEAIPAVFISNFEDLRVLKIDSLGLETMPTFDYLPTLQKLRISGNRIRVIVANVFSGYSITVADLSYNEINSIAHLAFTSRVLHLNLRCNKLTSFTDKWLQYPEAVKILDLSGNQIQEIVEDAFKRFTGISALSLFNNQIKTIGVAAFGYSPARLLLHLGFNNLSYLSPRMFKDGINIHLLRVDYNRLSFLPDTLLGKLKLKTISLIGNPWQCPCLRQIERWTPAIHIHPPQFKFPGSGSVPSCVVASNFTEVCLQTVDAELDQLFRASLPNVPADMCGVETANGLLGYYYDKWSTMHGLSTLLVQ